MSIDTAIILFMSLIVIGIVAVGIFLIYQLWFVDDLDYPESFLNDTYPPSDYTEWTTAPVAGDIKSGEHTLVYDGTQFLKWEPCEHDYPGHVYRRANKLESSKEKCGGCDEHKV